MKQLINQLYYYAKTDLEKMKKSNMTLCERIKYEKALTNLEAMKKVIDNCTITPNE